MTAIQRPSFTQQARNQKALGETPKFGYLKFDSTGVTSHIPKLDVELSTSTEKYGLYDLVLDETVRETIPADQFDPVLALLKDSQGPDALRADNGQTIRSRLSQVIDGLSAAWSEDPPWTKRALKEAVENNPTMEIQEYCQGPFLWLYA